MSAFIRCPECHGHFRYSSSQNTIKCPVCDAQFEADETDEAEVTSPRQCTRSSRSNVLLLIGLAGLAGFALLFCAWAFGNWRLRHASSSGTEDYSPPRAIPPQRSPQKPMPEQMEDYAQARQHFQTHLVYKKLPAPHPWPWPHDGPPAGVREVPYQSGNLRLRAWANAPPTDERRRPAVLFLHGGFAFGADDWEQTQPFRNAGFVVMTPMLRGENGLPGYYSMFYNEVEDVLAAAETLAKFSYVDTKRIYIAGHSVGGTLTMLAAMTSPRFRAAASFSGSPEQVSWTNAQPGFMVRFVAPFNRDDPREFQMRSPLTFPRSFKCPVRIYYGSQEGFFAENSQKLAQLAKGAGLDVKAIRVSGDHLSMVEPAMRQAIAFFQSK